MNRYTNPSDEKDSAEYGGMKHNRIGAIYEYAAACHEKNSARFHSMGIGRFDAYYCASVLLGTRYSSAPQSVQPVMPCSRASSRSISV